MVTLFLGTKVSSKEGKYENLVKYLLFPLLRIETPITMFPSTHVFQSYGLN